MKPILFNTEMVRAILDGRKTVTRRVVKPHYRDEEAGFRVVTNKHTGKYVRIEIFDEWEDETRWLNEPYRPGDILYVRETWYYESHMEDTTAGKPDLQSGRYAQRYIFKADCPEYPVDVGVGQHGWRPSIHMPREAARIFLRVKNVCVERLQEITIDGIKAEGSTKRYGSPGGCRCAWMDENCMNEPCGNRDAYEWHIYADPFADLIWNKTIKPKDRDLYGWDADPWVWVIGFERISREEALSDA